MPLSEEEQRLLEQMEEALAAEDPKFASALRGAASRRQQRRIVLACCLAFAAGVAVLMAGAVQMVTMVAVAGFLLMLGSAYLGLTSWRKLADPELPDNVTAIGKARDRSTAQRNSGFMNRMEDRWRRRRDDY